MRFEMDTERIANEAGLFLLILDDSVVVQELSANCQHILGYTPVELKGRAVKELLHPDDIGGFIQFHQKAITGQMADDRVKIRLASKEGDYIWISCLPEVLPNEKWANNKVCYLCQSINDIKTLEQDLKLRLSELEAIYRIGYATTRIADIKTLYQTVYQEIREIIPCDAFFISLYDMVREKGQKYVFHVDLIDNQPQVFEEVISRKSWIDEEIIKKRQAQLILRKPGEEDYGPLRPFGDESRRSASLMFAPMFFGDEVIGVISAQSYTYNGYNKSHLGLLQAIANYVAMAIKNAQFIERIKVSEQSYRTLVESSIEGVCVFQDYKFVLVNQALAQIFGYEKEELINKKGPLDLTHPEDQEKVKTMVQKRLSGEVKVVEYEFAGQRKDGQRILCEVRGSYIEYEGRPAIMSTLRDITKKKQTEQIMEHQRKFYECVIDSMPSAVTVIDKDFKIQYVSEGFLNLVKSKGMELKKEDRIGMNILDFYDSKERTWAKELFERIFKGEEKKISAPSHKFTNSQDKERTWEVYISPLYVGRQIEGAIMVRIDVSEEKRLEALLQQAQKMETLGTLVGGVAHDFNNMLTGIRGFADLALLETPNFDPRYKHLLKIVKAAERASELTQRLLAFSRRQLLDFRPTSLNRLIEGLNNLIGRVIGENISLVSSLDEKIKLISADISQLEQVILNLCVNARDAMSKGGKLIFKTSNIYLDEVRCKPYSWAKPGDYVMLSVTDTGIGMNPEVQKRIFEPFYTTKETGKGTGLGLAVVYGIVTQHRGIINVYSEIGQGTTFNLYFPAIDKAGLKEVVAAEETKEQITEFSGTETVLIAEDEAVVRTMAMATLEQYGYRVMAATDGQEAIRVFKKHKDKIDLVLADAIMPGISGVELIKQIRKIKPAQKIILASGYPAEVIKLEELKADHIPLVKKPYTPYTLLYYIRKTLSKQ